MRVVGAQCIVVPSAPPLRFVDLSVAIFHKLTSRRALCVGAFMGTRVLVSTPTVLVEAPLPTQGWGAWAGLRMPTDGHFTHTEGYILWVWAMGQNIWPVGCRLN